MKLHSKNIVEVKPYTLKQLSMLYGVHRKTLRNWLKPFEKEIGPRLGYIYMIPQVKIIFNKLSLPYLISIEDQNKESY